MMPCGPALALFSFCVVHCGMYSLLCILALASGSAQVLLQATHCLHKAASSEVVTTVTLHSRPAPPCSLHGDEDSVVPSFGKNSCADNASAGQPPSAQHSELLKEIEAMRQNCEQEHSIRQQVEWRLQNDVSSGSAICLADLLLLQGQSWYRWSSCSWQVIGSLVFTQSSCIRCKG